MQHFYWYITSLLEIDKNNSRFGEINFETFFLFFLLFGLKLLFFFYRYQNIVVQSTSPPNIIILAIINTQKIYNKLYNIFICI